MTLIEIIIARIVAMESVQALVGRNPNLTGDDALAIRDGMLHADDPYPGIVVDLASQEHEIGVHALAVPLRDMQGQTVAALNVVSSSQSGASPLTLLPLLLDAARELRPLL